MVIPFRRARRRPTPRPGARLGTDLPLEGRVVPATDWTAVRSAALQGLDTLEHASLVRVLNAPAGSTGLEGSVARTGLDVAETAIDRDLHQARSRLAAASGPGSLGPNA